MVNQPPNLREHFYLNYSAIKAIIICLFFLSSQNSLVLGITLFGEIICQPWARIDQLIKAWILRLPLTIGGVFVWCGPLASLLLQIASVALERNVKIMEVSTNG